MTAISALLERPFWELALGAVSLGALCVVAALAFFWVGFRIAEVSALAGFEGMFGLTSETPAGRARPIPAETAARLDAIRERGAAKASLNELAAATRKNDSAGARSRPRSEEIVSADEPPLP